MKPSNAWIASVLAWLGRLSLPCFERHVLLSLGPWLAVHVAVTQSPLHHSPNARILVMVSEWYTISYLVVLAATLLVVAAIRGVRAIRHEASCPPAPID